MKSTFIFNCLICLLGTVLLFPVVCLAADTITVNGSGSALDMMKPIIAAYQKSNKDVRIIIDKPLGSSGAIKALLAGALDLVLSSKQLKPEEIAKGAQQQAYGSTPMVFITDKKVGKSNISTSELEAIYSGKSVTWPNGEAIRLILRPTEDADTRIINTLSPGMAAAVSAARTRPGMTVAVTDPEAYSAVVKTPGSFGATGMTSIITEKLPVAALSLNGVAPSPKTLANGSYPISKEIIFITTAKTSPAALKLVSFMLSPQGRAIAGKTGVHVISGATPHK